MLVSPVIGLTACKVEKTPAPTIHDGVLAMERLEALGKALSL
ncbi:hypothetical protein ACMDCR_07540 [Labrys okinawensis]